MKKHTVLIVFLLLSSSLMSQVYLTQVDSIKIDQAQIWGGISWDGRSINITTMMADSGQNHIFLVKLDTSLSQTATPVQLTTNADVFPGKWITDHKHLNRNSDIYVSFSLNMDEDLFLFRVDTAGNRIGGLDTVVANSSDPTNDMILCTNNNMLFVLHFRPGMQHIVRPYDFTPSPSGLAFTTSSTLPHNNIGSTVFKDGRFFLFTGDIFGLNADLILTKWYADWLPVSGSSQVLIPSFGGDGKWFATGSAWDQINNRWYVGYNHILPGQTIGQEHTDIAIFDSSFNLLDTINIAGNGTARPHFLILDGYLYVTYDGLGVFVKKFQINPSSTGIETMDSDAKLEIYPNPLKDKCSIECKGLEKGPYNLYIYDNTGKLLLISYNSESAKFSLNRGDIPSGIILIRVSGADGKTASGKLIIE